MSIRITKMSTSRQNVIIYGIGHAGIEAILITGMVYILYLLMQVIPVEALEGILLAFVAVFIVCVIRRYRREEMAEA